MSQIGLLLLIAVMTALFVQGRFRYDVIALGGLLIVAISGLLPAKEVFSGLSHPVILTVAAVLVLSRGLQKSGAVDLIAEWISRQGWHPNFQIGLLVVLVTVLSAFVNNIGALSLILPVGLRLAHRAKLPTSQFLMSLAFGAILGGLFCIISTPVNLLVSGVRATALGKGFEFFDFTPVGATVMVVGLAYMLVAHRWLLPVRLEAAERGGVLDLAGYTSELKVPEESPLVGQSLVEIQDLEKFQVVVVSIHRTQDIDRHPGGHSVVEAGDRLIVECDPTHLDPFLSATGLELVAPDDQTELAGSEEEWGVYEAVIPPGSDLVEKNAQNVNLRYEYGLNLVGIARRGARIRTRLSRTRLRAGDILLVQASNSAFLRAAQELGLLRLAKRKILRKAPRRPLWLAVTLFVGAILVAAFGLLPVEQAFMLGAFLMVATGVLTAQESYNAIDWPMLVLLACMLPLGHALETTGAAHTIAEAMVSVGSFLPPRGMLAVFIATTTILANLMNNKAATGLMAPISLSLAQELGWNPDILLMAVAVGAEFVFISPIGHQCNLLILGPGSYKFGDFVRFGGPLALVCLITAVIVLPIVWPFQ